MNTMSLTQKFAAEEAKGIVPAMVKAIKAAKRDTRLIVAGVLAITYHHQASWLTTIEGVGILGWAIPIVVDLAMLRMLGIVQTTGMRRQGKKAALVMTGVLATMSAAVNIAVPGAIAARLIFGALVLIAAGVKVVTALVGPDFAEMEATESAVQSAAAPAGTVDEAAIARRAEITAKANATRERNRIAAEQKAAEEAEAKALKNEERRLARQAKKVAEAAPFSSYPAVILTAEEKEAVAHLARR